MHLSLNSKIAWLRKKHCLWNLMAIIVCGIFCQHCHGQWIINLKHSDFHSWHSSCTESTTTARSLHLVTCGVVLCFILRPVNRLHPVTDIGRMSCYLLFWLRKKLHVGSTRGGEIFKCTGSVEQPVEQGFRFSAMCEAAVITPNVSQHLLQCLI